jgi:hypothetical protein
MDDVARLVHEIFYIINKNQHFEFPHSNCDRYKDEELADLYFKQSGFGSYCCAIITSRTGNECIVDTLRHNSQFVNYVSAWMRLKFTAEQVDPLRYARYFERLPIPAHKTPKLPSELLELYKADCTEFYGIVDSLANRIQLRWIEMLLGHERNDDKLDYMCTRINREYIQFRTTTFDPYELPIKPFLEFQHKLRLTLSSQL